jgi:hypothetical protein
MHATLRPMIAVALAVLAVAPAPAADAPLDAADFEALTTGRTFYYNSAGQPYGVEQYLPGRKVIWAFTGDDCRKGEWYPDGPFICFVYDDDGAPQCWTFFQSNGRLTAQFQGDPAGDPLIAVEESPAPMACLGPNVGV